MDSSFTKPRAVDMAHVDEFPTVPRGEMQDELDVATKRVARGSRADEPIGAGLGSGSRVGNYVLGRRIAEGGMGIVYEAHHSFLRRAVAIKVLRQSKLDKPDIARRFFHEALAATRIGHPGVVEVLDYGHAEDGSAFLVMELLTGITLTDRLHQRVRLPLDEALEVGRSLADTLFAAHAAGVVHRDLQPDHVFLATSEGSPVEQIKVLDFGVAKFFEPADHERTRRGKLLGTPFYMSPEQCVGKIEVDHRSDIYSLGCVLFELLTGSRPFRGHTMDLLISHRHRPPPTVRSLNPDVPLEIEALIARMLAKDPDHRPQSMAHVLAELSGTRLAPDSRPLAPTLAADVSTYEPMGPRSAIGTFARALLLSSAIAGVSYGLWYAATHGLL